MHIEKKIQKWIHSVKTCNVHWRADTISRVNWNGISLSLSLSLDSVERKSNKQRFHHSSKEREKPKQSAYLTFERICAHCVCVCGICIRVKKLHNHKSREKKTLWIAFDIRIEMFLHGNDEFANVKRDTHTQWGEKKNNKKPLTHSNVTSGTHREVTKLILLHQIRIFWENVTRISCVDKRSVNLLKLKNDSVLDGFRFSFATNSMKLWMVNVQFDAMT